MRVLVAGGAGYVGSVLVPMLRQLGHEAEVADLLWFGNHLPKDVPVRKVDLFDLGVEDLRGYERVVFLAGLSNDPMAEYSRSENYVQNSAAPAYLAHTAKLAGVRRFVYASSCSVYGNAGEAVCDEDFPAFSTYAYGISKMLGEDAVMGFPDDNFSVIALRKGTVSGYSPRMRFDLLVNTMFRSAMERGVIFVRNPAIWRPVLGVKDAAMAYIAAMFAPEYVSGTYNIASQNCTVGEVAIRVVEVIRQRIGVDCKVDIENAADGRNYRVDCGRAKEALGFRPIDTVESITNDLIDHLADYGPWGASRYSNIATFREMHGERAA